MTKIEELISEIQDSSILVSHLLRKAKVFASKLDQTDFLSWINMELKGYQNDDKYPDYRRISGVIKAWDPYRGWVPVLFQSSEVESSISHRSTKQSIPEIEELLTDKSGSFEMPYPASTANRILAKSPIKTKVSLFFDSATLVGVLNGVRNRLLEWALELEKQGIKGEDMNFTVEEKQEAQSIDSNYSIGHIENFNGNIGEGNKYLAGKILSPSESFFSKFFWYVIVALVVIIIGNVLSSIILKYLFNI